MSRSPYEEACKREIDAVYLCLKELPVCQDEENAPWEPCDAFFFKANRPMMAYAFAVDIVDKMRAHTPDAVAVDVEYDRGQGKFIYHAKRRHS